jgi:hypothetical protein
VSQSLLHQRTIGFGDPLGSNRLSRIDLRINPFLPHPARLSDLKKSAALARAAPVSGASAKFIFWHRRKKVRDKRPCSVLIQKGTVQKQFFYQLFTKGGNNANLNPNFQQEKEVVPLNHSEYVEKFRNFLDGKKDDKDFSRLALGCEKEISILLNLNLDSVLPILLACYCPTVRRKPRDCLSMFRACLFMTLLRIQGTNQWAKDIRSNALYAAACGFDPDDTPGVGTYYDFMKRIIDGPYRKPENGTVKKSEYNAMKHRRNLKGEKDRRKDDLDPNHPKSEIVSKKLLADADKPRPAGMLKILEDLLFAAGIIPSLEAGLFSLTEELVVSGDGSIMETAASRRGRPTCDCRSRGIFKCDHDRLYESPTADFCWDHIRKTFVFGDRYYHLITTRNGHDFPLCSCMPGGNVSDYTLSLETFDRFAKAANENGAPCSISIFCGDCHHDSYAHYRFFDKKGVDTVIPLSAKSKKVSVHLPGRDEVRLDADGTPLCPAGKPMRYQHFNGKKQTHVFNCPAKRPARRDGKRKFVFHREECPNRKDCMFESTMAPFAYIKSSDDPRMFPRIPRNSERYRKIRNQRSASERVNFINDAFRLERCCRNADYGLVRIYFGNIAHHALVRYAENKAGHLEKGPVAATLNAMRATVEKGDDSK